MKHIPCLFFAFAVAGTVAAAASSDISTQQADIMNSNPEHFADFHVTGINRELSHAPIYGTFFAISLR